MTDRFRYTETWTGLLLISLTLLLGSTLLLISGVRSPILLVLALTSAIALLLGHSLQVTADAFQIEVRLGNGILRSTIEWEDVTAVESIDVERPRWGYQRRDNVTVYGLRTGPAVRILERNGRETVVALPEASVLTAAGRRWMEDDA